MSSHIPLLKRVTSSRVWSRCRATRIDGSLANFCIRDLPKNRVEDAVELIMKYYIKEEPFHKAAGVARNPQAMAEYRANFTKHLYSSDPTYHNVICCEDRNDGRIGQILGVSSMILTVVDEPPKRMKIQTKELQTLRRLLDIEDVYLRDQFKKLHVTNFYGDNGIIVHPEFRKYGIALQFIRQRFSACVAHNVAAIGGIATSVPTQKACRKENFDDVLDVNLQELGPQHGVSFENNPMAKLLIWRNPKLQPIINQK